MATQIYRRANQLSPIEQHGKPIWVTPFEVSIAYKDTCSPEYLRLFGMPTVGDPTIDATMHNQLCHRYVTINQMVEYFKKGIAVRVVNHADTKRIYELITNYLLAWKENLQTGINIGDAPIDDLILLDRFANVVYQHAVQHFTPEFLNSRLMQQLNGEGKWKSRDSLVKPKAVNEKGEVARHPQRESMSQLFSDRVIRGGRQATSPDGEVPKSRWARSR